MEHSRPTEQSYEEEMGEYIAAALGIDPTQAQELAAEHPYDGVIVEDTDTLTSETVEGHQFYGIREEDK
jgi:hypothetical protein